MMNKKIEINERISQIIDYQCNGNQKRFADIIGFAPQVVFNIVSGRKSKPSYDVLSAIKSSFVDLNSEWLLTGEGNMLKSDNSAVNERDIEYNRRNLIPLFEDVQTFGGTTAVANVDAVSYPSEWIDAGDWFPGATAAIRHYGDSMPEYPSGCILALKKVTDRNLIVWGRNYCIETSEYRVTKKIYDSGDAIMAHSTNEETYKSGMLVHPPFTIPKKSITNMYLVLGYVVKEYSNGPIFIRK